MIVLKIIGWVLLALLSFLFLLTLLSVKVDAQYKDERFVVKIKYAFLSFTVFPPKDEPTEKKEEPPKSTIKKKDSAEKPPPDPPPTKPEPPPPKQEQVETKEQDKEEREPPPKRDTPELPGEEIKEEAEEEEKKSLRQQIDTALPLLRSSKSALRTIRRHFIVDRLSLLFYIAGENAHDAALNFGKHEILVTNLLALLEEFVQLRIKEIHLHPDFLSDTSTYQGEVRLRIRPIWVIKAALSLLFAYLMYRRKQKKDIENSSKGGHSYERETTTS